MPKRFFLTLIAVFVLSLSLLGCTTAPKDSAKDFSGEEKTIATVIETLQKAAEKQDGKKVCKELLAKEILTKFQQQKTDCEKAINAALNDATVFELEVKNVHVRGTQATATVSMKKQRRKKTTQIKLLKDQKTWKISSIG